ncbi:serine/threonine protein kinase [Frankia sp. B2]|nr:serine/threonine protein kinase [Frankia sp. B2]
MSAREGQVPAGGGGRGFADRAATVAVTTPDGSVPWDVANSRATPLLDSDPVTVGTYQLVARLGQGGMGIVYLGRSRDGRPVAVKVVRTDLARQPEFLARFRREAEVAQRVARFCTAEVLEVDVEADRPYLVTEFIDGPTLADAIAANGPMAEADLERLAISVAAALTAIHAAGMIHRDLKPSNVLLSRLGPRVIDFGIARAMDSTTSLTTSTGLIGTPAFMAPEQARGALVTAAADIFAWGGVVTFAGTGIGPFGKATTPVLLYRAVHEAPKIDGLPDGLRSIVAKTMSKEPADRPTASDLYQSLLGLSNVDEAVRGEAGPTAVTVVTDPPVKPPARMDAGASRTPSDSVGSVGSVGSANPAMPPPSDDILSPLDLSPLDRPAPGRGYPEGGEPKQQQRQRRGRWQRRTVVSLVASLCAVAVAVTATLMFVTHKDPASVPESIEVSRRLASEAAAASTTQPQLARQLALAAYRVEPTEEAQRSLIENFGGVEINTLVGHTERVIGVRFSPNGRMLVTGSDDSTVRLWDISNPMATRPLAVIPGDSGTFLQGGFSADGRLLSTSTDDHIVRLWDISVPERPRSLAVLRDVNNSVAFAVGGKTMATAGTDNTAKLWDITDPHQPRLAATLVGHTDWVNTVAFSPDGRMLATGSHDRTIRLWDVSTPTRPTPLAILNGHENAVLGLAFRPDGRILGSTSADRSARLWDIATPTEPKMLYTFTDRSDWVSSVAFRVDLHLMGTTARKAARLWDISDPRNPRPVGGLLGHTATVRRVQFSPDGTLAATSGDDNTARLWDIDPAHIAKRACTDPTAVMSEAEWERHAPQIPYPSRCP